MMKKVTQFWEQKGIANYLIYTASGERGWEMAPVEGDRSSLLARVKAFFLQLVVIVRVTFGRYTHSTDERKSLHNEYREITSQKVEKVAEERLHAGEDAFCKRPVIDSQQIWEGKHIRVLFNYAPIGAEKLHFLLTPKAHKEKFSELSKEEFEEVQTFAKTLVEHYSEHKYYRYNKTGSLAGQTVPHFHEHVVFVRPQHEFWGQLSVFLRMLIPPSPLSSLALAKKVSSLKTEFTVHE